MRGHRREGRRGGRGRLARRARALAAEELARDVAALGFRHLVYTDIARDGMQTGVEAAAYAAMAEAFGHPVIASGGVAGVADLVRLGEVAGGIEGVIAGRAVYEGALSVADGVRACDEATRRAEAVAMAGTRADCNVRVSARSASELLASSVAVKD